MRKVDEVEEVVTAGGGGFAVPSPAVCCCVCAAGCDCVKEGSAGGCGRFLPREVGEAGEVFNMTGKARRGEGVPRCDNHVSRIEVCRRSSGTRG